MTDAKYILSNKDRKGVMLCYTPISEMAGFFVDDFAKEFTYLQSVCNEITVRFNTIGGDVFAGNTLYNLFKTSKVPVRGIVDGVVCSIGTIIFAGCHIKEMAPYALYMIHDPVTIAQGTEEKLRASADLLATIKGNLRAQYAAETGMAEKAIELMMAKETWLNAQDALDKKFINAITDYNTTNQPPKNLLENKQPQALYNFYNQDLVVRNQLTENTMNKIAEKLNLPQNSSEDAIVSAINTLNKTYTDKVTELQNKLKEAENAAFATEVNNYLTKAVDEKKITAAEKESYADIAVKGGWESVKKIVDGKPAVASIGSQLKPDASADKYKDWTFEDYQKKDPAALAQLKSNNWDVYAQLFKDEYGTDPKKNN